jgi:hypothetical protein
MKNQSNWICKACFLLIFMVCFFPSLILGQETDIVILTTTEADKLRVLIHENPKVRAMYDSIKVLADKGLTYNANPQTQISYEGMLPTHPDRKATEESLKDMDRVVNLIYASYGENSAIYGEKAKQYVLAWSEAYVPTGNPINENKLTALFWAFYLFNDLFTAVEQQQVEEWMKAIGRKEVEREKTPNNNWEAKRLKLIATIGSILKLDEFNSYAVEGFKDYIASAYYADGTSNDLRERNALHYHVSGLKPTVAVFVNGVSFDSAYNLFDYLASSGSSVEQSVMYVVPYAKGEQQREEWTNSKATIDKRRAEAGLSEYQPGKLYDPNHAIPLLEWTGFFRDDVYGVFGKEAERYTAHWVGLLNSPLVRSRKH